MEKCAICEFLTESYFINVDNEYPPQVKSLKILFWVKSRSAGYEGFGLAACPQCGAWYYDEKEYSFTGSQMNDDECYYRLTADEKGLLAPLLEDLKRIKNSSGKPDEELDKALTTILTAMNDSTYRGISPKAIANGIRKFLSESPGGKYSAPLNIAVRKWE